MKFVIVCLLSGDNVKTIGPFTTLKRAQVAASRLGKKVTETFYDNGYGILIRKLLPPGAPIDVIESEEE